MANHIILHLPELIAGIPNYPFAFARSNLFPNPLNKHCLTKS